MEFLVEWAAFNQMGEGLFERRWETNKIETEHQGCQSGVGERDE